MYKGIRQSVREASGKRNNEKEASSSEDLLFYIHTIHTRRPGCENNPVNTMKVSLSAAALCLSLSGSASAFHPAASVRRTTALNGLDLSGNSWKPDSEKMGSTDTGDYFPEGYDPNEIAFTEGWQGSQELLVDKDRGGPQLPGLENVGADGEYAQVAQFPYSFP